MIYARVRLGRRSFFALVEGDSVRPLRGPLFGRHTPADLVIPLSQVQLLAPVRPGKILAAAVNYQSHVQQSRSLLGDVPARPELFLKPASAVVGPGEPIVLPKGEERVDYEGELVAIIGRPCRRVTPAEALEYVFGYTCGNDVSARTWQRGDLQWWRAKGADTFAPLGPWIVTGLNPRRLRLRTRLNGRVVQEASTADLIYGVAELVSFASQIMTLEPGDAIFTGTPGDTGPLRAGDVVEVEIEGIGVLRNSVIAEE
jgi:2-keto-4-pentenoate hydratase/2-oxohepta-3-ene-1,7-dioic acid hydratase in catechol pathway